MQLKNRESSQELVEKEHAPGDSPQYYFGICSWHPKWMQTAFANAKFFTFLLCVNGLVEGALASGKSVSSLGHTELQGLNIP